MKLSGWRFSWVMAAKTPPVCIPTLERGNENMGGDSGFCRNRAILPISPPTNVGGENAACAGIGRFFSYSDSARLPPFAKMKAGGRWNKSISRIFHSGESRNLFCRQLWARFRHSPPRRHSRVGGNPECNRSLQCPQYPPMPIRRLILFFCRNRAAE